MTAEDDNDDDGKQDPIARQFGISPLGNVKPKLDLKPIKAETGVDTARGNLDNIIVVATRALQDVLQIAEESGSSKDYRVLTELISAATSATKTYADLDKDEVAIEKARRAMGQLPDGEEVEKTTQLTPDELLDLIGRKD